VVDENNRIGGVSMAEFEMLTVAAGVILLLYAFNKVLPFKGPLDVRGVDIEDEKEWRPISTV